MNELADTAAQLGPSGKEPRVELSFSDRRLRDLCAKAATAERTFGTNIAHCLQRCVADLRAADVVSALPLDELEHVGKGRLALTFGDALAIVFEPAGRPPTDPDGTVDWSRVSRVRIISVGSPA